MFSIRCFRCWGLRCARFSGGLFSCLLRVSVGFAGIGGWLVVGVLRVVRWTWRSCVSVHVTPIVSGLVVWNC